MEKVEKRNTLASAEIISDHRLIKRLFRQWESEPEGTERDLELVARCLCEIEVHSRAEEEIFYPECRRLLGVNESIIDHYKEDHFKIDALIKELRAKGTLLRSEDFQSLVDDVRSHIEEEEENLLPQVDNLISIHDSLALGRKLRIRRRVLRDMYVQRQEAA